MKGRDIPRKKVYDFITKEVERRLGKDAEAVANAENSVCFVLLNLKSYSLFEKARSIGLHHTILPR